MLKYFVDGNSRFHISVKHCANEVNAIFAHDVWNPKIAVHDFVDTVERILLVDNGVEKNAKCPDILLLATVGLSS
tara:strand:- start:497 stop:721 length:225 start_codon:yes stop_codon:yes gene_type:complete